MEKGKSFTTLDNSRTIFLSEHDMSFIESLRALPAEIKIQLMQLTEADMLTEIETKKLISANHLLKLLKQTWFWKETGEIADIDSILYPSPVEVNKINTKVKVMKYSNLFLTELIDLFEGDNSEVYQKIK